MPLSLPACCELAEVKVSGLIFSKKDLPPRLTAMIRGFTYEKGSDSSIWTRWPTGERDVAKYWFKRLPDYVCGCGGSIFTLRNRNLVVSARCENCGHEEPL